MNLQKKLGARRTRRRMRVGNRVRGDAERPRLTVFRSQKHIYAQLVDDGAGRTLCASTSRMVCGAYGGTVAHAKQVGADLAAKELEAIPRKDRQRIISRIQELQSDPRPSGCEKLSGEEKYRLRQGDYRILYEILDRELIVTVVKIGNRREVYR